MTVEELEKWEAEFESTFLEISRDLKIVRSQFVKARSVAWIKANGVTRANVESSNVPGTFFGTVWKFVEFLKANPQRQRFAEWNTVIYYTEELIAGHMPDMPGRYEDLPE